MRTSAVRAAGLRGMDARYVDALVAVGLAAASAVAGRQYHPAGWPRFDALAYVLSVLVSLPLAWRRRAPVPVLLASCAAFAVYIAAGYQPSLNFWGPMVALYGVAAHRPPRTAAAGAALTAAVIFYSGLSAPELGALIAVVQAVVVPSVVWVFGNGARLLAERNHQLAAVTAQLRLEQEWRARQAVVEEQRRIARELHDVVAHHMSVISVQAGMAGYVFSTAPETTRAALGTIAETSHEALRELRRMLVLLRSGAEDAVGGGEDGDGRGDGTVDDRTPYAPMPGLARLPEVAGRIRAAGVPVEVRTTGEVRPLPPGVDLCAYRVVQEALTNVLKHARSANVTVLVEYRPDLLVITVTDDGGDSRDDRRDRSLHANVPPPSGHGLIGMRERARLYGGTVDAGPRAEGGFRVRLTLPTRTGAEGPGRRGEQPSP
ncbi:sensor histidine kinase [Streptomyces sp. NPDC059786]|uniref:sensor histidine kinase n=1 Tax=Streptomyces sp. NPDC059786 TaxID=3346946 RepID=UPI003651B4C0